MVRISTNCLRRLTKAANVCCGPSGKGLTQWAASGGLLEAVLTRQNLQTAWLRVKANKGAAGVDGLDIEAAAQMLRTSWAEIRDKLLTGQ